MNAIRWARMSGRIRGLAGLAALALVLAACSNGGGDVAAPEAPAAPSAPDAGPPEGGTLRVGLPVTVVTLDPHGRASTERTTLTVVQHFMDTLVLRDGDQFEPRLATSWASPDPLTWVFQLRQGVEFHDGTPFSADDVVASVERVKSGGGPASNLWVTLDSVRATGEHEVTIKTTAPLGPMLTNLAQLFIGPADQMEDAAFWTSPVGTGPFKVGVFVPDGFIRLDAFAGYWDGRPSLDSIEFRQIPEASSRLTALVTGEIDITYDIPPDQLPTLLRADEITVETVPSYTYYFIWFNNSLEPFTDVRVRQAMWHALDVEAIVGDLFAGVGQVASSPIPQTVFGSGDELQQYEYNPELARQLLAEAGFSDGFKTSIQWNSECCPNIRALTQTMVSYWRDIGVEVELLEKERAVWLADLLALNWEMNVQTNNVQTGDADFTLGRLYTTAANRLGYSNPEVDQFLGDARSASDQSVRADLYAKAARRIWEDAAGIFPVDLLSSFAWRDNVQGFVPVADDRPRFHEVSLRP